MDEGIAVLLAAALATIGIGFSGRQQRSLQRRQHTYQVLDRHNDWPLFDSNLIHVGHLVRDGRVPSRDEPGREDDIERIDFILNYYEFLSAAIWNGDIEEALVRECERGRIIRLSTTLAAYIRWNRDTFSLTMWTHLDRLAARWEKFPTGTTGLDRGLEYMLGRPLASLSRR